MMVYIFRVKMMLQLFSVTSKSKATLILLPSSQKYTYKSFERRSKMETICNIEKVNKSENEWNEIWNRNILKKQPPYPQ